MKNTDKLKGVIRNNIIKTLVILSSRDEQRKYPFPAEWFCFWFNDYYHPKDHTFQLAFTITELKALSNFNDLFEQIAKQIGDPPSRPNKLWIIPEWQDVIQGASETLKKLRDT